MNIDQGADVGTMIGAPRIVTYKWRTAKGRSWPVLSKMTLPLSEWSLGKHNAAKSPMSVEKNLDLRKRGQSSQGQKTVTSQSSQVQLMLSQPLLSASTAPLRALAVPRGASD